MVILKLQKLMRERKKENVLTIISDITMLLNMSTYRSQPKTYVDKPNQIESPPLLCQQQNGDCKPFNLIKILIDYDFDL